MSQEPAAEWITISGYLTSTAENPVISRIRIAIGNEISEGVTNAAGYYEFETDRLGRNVAIYPHDNLWDVRAYPDTSFHDNVSGDVRQDFTISPGVVVYVNYGRVHYEFGGTQVWVAASKVAEFDDIPYAIFYPDVYWLGHNGTLWFGRPFTRYSPQDTEGVPDIHDAGTLQSTREESSIATFKPLKNIGMRPQCILGTTPEVAAGTGSRTRRTITCPTTRTSMCGLTSIWLIPGRAMISASI